MAIGDLIRDLRLLHGWTQVELASELSEAAGNEPGSMHRNVVRRWETGKVIPGPHWLRALSQAFDVPLPLLTAEARLSRMDRRAFLNLTALTATHGKAASDMLCSVAGGDSGPLATVQTTHATDLVIAALADKTALRYLRGWMADGSDPVLRVNAAGILAKAPGQDEARDVARTLAHDAAVRTLYLTAVVSRVCATDWSRAARVVADPIAVPATHAAFLGSRLAAEVTNNRDSGARWCAASMLRDLSPLLGRQS